MDGKINTNNNDYDDSDDPDNCDSVEEKNPKTFFKAINNKKNDESDY
jgi:hypothetical protein